MKNKILALALLAGAALSIQAWAQTCCTNLPWQAETLVVNLDPGGLPPGFDQPANPTWATAMQVEFWQVAGIKQKLFARVWASDATLQTEWVPIGEGDWAEQVRLRGTGPGGLRIFPVGSYVVRWRGWNPCGFGPWSAETAFTVALPANIATCIVSAPEGETDEVAVSWSNDFAASKTKIAILRGTKIVRSKTLAGGYGYRGAVWEKTGSYWDQPSSPAKELPDGTGYVFRVSAYSTMLKKWSPWVATPAFQISRPAPVLPILTASQKDYYGWFGNSLRPYFYANYGNHAPLWSYFEIKQKVGAKTKVVRRQWVSRNSGWGYDYQGGVHIGGGSESSQSWANDLPPGEYAWRVQAWNGMGAGQSAWTPEATATVVAVSPLAQPDADSIKFSTPLYAKWQNMQWQMVPNAYRYNVEMKRNGKPFRNVKNMDSSSGRIYLWNNSSPQVDWWLPRAWLPEGRYTFRVQAVNKGYPAGQQVSDWSAPSREFVVNTSAPKATQLETWAWGYEVYLWAEYNSPFWLDKQYEVVCTGCDQFAFVTEDDNLTLPAGTYKWRVRQRSAWRGWGPWSDWSDEFEVEAPWWR